jgi:ABC-2 type transport system permease protein
MLSIILTGAALIREREHGTIEHLLVMPVTPTEIMLAKVWSMGLVGVAGGSAVLRAHRQGALRPCRWTARSGCSLAAPRCTCHHHSMGIFMATLARNMPQFGLLVMLVMMPLQMLSGGMTRARACPPGAMGHVPGPTTHFTELSQAILYRGAGLAVVWPSLLALALIGSVLFALSLRRFRRAIAQMA